MIIHLTTSHHQASYERTYSILGLNERVIDRDDLYVTMLHAVVVFESALLFLAEKQITDKDGGALTHCGRPGAGSGPAKLLTEAGLTYNSSNAAEAVDSDLGTVSVGASIRWCGSYQCFRHCVI